MVECYGETKQNNPKLFPVRKLVVDRNRMLGEEPTADSG